MRSTKITGTFTTLDRICEMHLCHYLSYTNVIYDAIIRSQIQAPVEQNILYKLWHPNI